VQKIPKYKSQFPNKSQLPMTEFSNIFGTWDLLFAARFAGNNKNMLKLEMIKMSYNGK